MRPAPKITRSKSTPQCAAARIKPHDVLWNSIDPLLQAMSNLLARASIGKILILLFDLGKRWAVNAICRARLSFHPSSFATQRRFAKPAYAEIKQRSGKGIAPEATGWCHARDGNPHSLEEPALTPEGSRYQAGGSALLYKDLAKTGDRVDKPSKLIYRIMCDVLGGPDHTGILSIDAYPAHNIAGVNAAGFIVFLVR